MFKRNDQFVGTTTPRVELSEGIRPAQLWQVAAYLPLIRYDRKVNDWKVISTGKILAIDSSNFLVPAGIVKDIARAKSLTTAAWTTENKAGYTYLYTANDVANGVLNSLGATAVAGDPVVMSFFTGATGSALGTENRTVGKPVGIAPYDFWRQNGAGYAQNPMSYTYDNYNLQAGVGILTRGFIELPVVANTSAVVLTGMTVYTGASPKPGDLVTFDAESNFVTLTALAASTFDADTETDPSDAEIKAESDRIGTYINDTFGAVLGRILFVDTTFPKDYLDYVRTWVPNINSVTALDKAPGTATLGLPDNVTYAGVSVVANAKVVRINVLI